MAADHAVICFGTLFMAFHATQGPIFGLPQMASGLHGAFGWSAGCVAVATAVLAAALAIFGYDWVHRVFRFLLVISLPCYAIISVAVRSPTFSGSTGSMAPGAGAG